jgi:hypothetical protein
MNTDPFGVLTPSKVVGGQFCFFDVTRADHIGNCVTGPNWPSGGGGGTNITNSFTQYDWTQISNHITNTNICTPEQIATGQTADCIIITPGGSGLTGQGTPGRLARWFGATNLGDSLFYEFTDNNGVVHPGVGNNNNNFFTQLFNVAGNIKTLGLCLPDDQHCINKWSDLVTRDFIDTGISELNKGNGIVFTGNGADPNKITTSGTISADTPTILTAIGDCGVDKVIQGFDQTTRRPICVPKIQCVGTNCPPPPPGVTGGGTPGYLPKWVGGSVLGDSMVRQYDSFPGNPGAIEIGTSVRVKSPLGISIRHTGNVRSATGIITETNGVDARGVDATVTGQGSIAISGVSSGNGSTAGSFTGYPGSMALVTSGPLKFTGINEGDKKVLASDATGNASWKSLSELGGGGGGGGNCRGGAATSQQKVTNYLLGTYTPTTVEFAELDVDGDNRITQDDYAMCVYISIGITKAEAVRKAHGAYGAEVADAPTDPANLYVDGRIGVGVRKPKDARLEVSADKGAAIRGESTGNYGIVGHGNTYGVMGYNNLGGAGVVGRGGGPGGVGGDFSASDKDGTAVIARAKVLISATGKSPGVAGVPPAVLPPMTATDAPPTPKTMTLPSGLGFMSSTSACPSGMTKLDSFTAHISNLHAICEPNNHRLTTWADVPGGVGMVVVKGASGVQEERATCPSGWTTLDQMRDTGGDLIPHKALAICHAPNDTKFEDWYTSVHSYTNTPVTQEGPAVVAPNTSVYGYAAVAGLHAKCFAGYTNNPGSMGLGRGQLDAGTIFSFVPGVSTSLDTLLYKGVCYPLVPASESNIFSINASASKTIANVEKKGLLASVGSWFSSLFGGDEQQSQKQTASVSSLIGTAQAQTAPQLMLEVGGKVRIADGTEGLSTGQTSKILASFGDGTASWKSLTDLGITGGGTGGTVGPMGPAGPAGPQGPAGTGATIANYNSLPAGSIAGYGVSAFIQPQTYCTPTSCEIPDSVIAAKVASGDFMTSFIAPMSGKGCEAGWKIVTTGAISFNIKDNAQLANEARTYAFSCIKR